MAPIGARDNLRSAEKLTIVESRDAMKLGAHQLETGMCAREARSAWQGAAAMILWKQTSKSKVHDVAVRVRRQLERSFENVIRVIIAQQQWPNAH